MKTNKLKAFGYGFTHIFNGNALETTGIKTIEHNAASFFNKSSERLRQINEQYAKQIKRAKKQK